MLTISRAENNLVISEQIRYNVNFVILGEITKEWGESAKFHTVLGISSVPKKLKKYKYIFQLHQS